MPGEIKMTDKIFKRSFFILSACILVVFIIRAIVVPFCHDETATFFYYIQPGDFLPYTSHLDTNNHTLNSFLAWICFHLFGDSPISLRLPNLVALVVLIFAVYRLAEKLNYTSAKIILVAGLLLSFHWLNFFDVCRGYGISMALMALAFSYVPDYIEDKRLLHILKIYILLDLAICANLMLIIVALLATALIVLFQLYHRRFFKANNIILVLIHGAIVFFWVKYSFFLQHYLQPLNFTFAGQGSSYWRVTFETLIYAIVGKQNVWIDVSIILIYISLMAAGLYFLIKNRKKQPSHQSTYSLFLIVFLNGLVIGFYLLKKLCGINFPEDRTGLFFYVLFILNAAFIVDMLKPRFSNSIAVVTFFAFALHFASNLNFRKHSLDMYDIIPERFYDRLLQEQKQNPQKITVGGNRFRELFYAFMNYRHNGELNLMDIPDDPNDMCMTDDYYVALKVNRKDYLPYYTEIDTDKDYGFALLKRKQFLTRKPLFVFGRQELEIDKTKEYSNFFDIKDTTFNTLEPLLVELNFTVPDGDMPSYSWIVLGLDSAEGKTEYYKRIPMNWVKYNWAGTENNDLVLETGPLPKKVHRLVCYLWNGKGQKLKIAVNTIKIFQLEGYGSNVDIHAKGNF